MNLTLQSIPSTIITEIFASSDLDGIVLDTEHGYYNNETLVSCVQITTLLKKKCFVRFADLNKQLIRMCLDAGADGIIFSTIEDPIIAKDMIEYCKYPIHGGKRGSALVRENKWGREKMSDKKPILVGQIETKLAVDNIDELLQCGFDNFVIGPYDLSSSLGCTADWTNELYIEYTNKIYNKIPLEKLGAFLPSVKDINMFHKSGRQRPSILIWGLDADFIINGINNLNLK
jgi:2-keto-3-deoxy-L-rhamnonate aldolase RhmA